MGTIIGTGVLVALGAQMVLLVGGTHPTVAAALAGEQKAVMGMDTLIMGMRTTLGVTVVKPSIVGMVIPLVIVVQYMVQHNG
jgi:hypothetical protein